jgi:hypothetical protein
MPRNFLILAGTVLLLFAGLLLNARESEGEVRRPFALRWSGS